MASTQRYSINLGLADTPETNNPEIYAEASRIYNAIKALAGGLDSYTGALQPEEELWPVLTPSDTIHSQGTNRLFVQYSEAVPQGYFVTLWDDAGVLKAKKAGGNPWAGDCRGYCSVNGGVLAAGDYGEVVLFGLHPYVSGATRGALYYISNVTAGILTATKPIAHNEYIQPVAFGLSDTELFFNPSILVPKIDATSLAITVLVP